MTDNAQTGRPPTACRSIARVLSDYHWYLLAVAAVVAFVLGYIGFGQLWHEQHEPSNWSDALYWSFKTFLLNSPADPNLPWTLDIARFLAPVVAGYAGLSAVGVLFRDRLQQMRIPLMRRHVVMCGLGYVGSLFLRHLRATGARVVVIESDPANSAIQLCRSLGVPVVIGDAQTQRTLQAAGIERADRLLAVTSDDAVNAEIVAAAGLLTTGRSGGVVRCLARIGDPELCALLRVQEAETEPTSSLDFFNTDEISARLMLDDFPIDIESSHPHIIVADLGLLGGWVVYHAARGWHERRADNTVPLVITVVDPSAEECVGSLLDRYPALEPVCRFICLSPSVRELQRLSEHHAKADAPPPARAYVTAYRDEDGLDIALKLRHELDDDVPVVVALSQTEGMARLVDQVGGAGDLNIEVFRTLERTCTVDLVQGGSTESIACGIHRRWCVEEAAKGKPAPSWSEIDESRKESSRAQARDISAKLRSIGCEIAPLRDWDASDFVFTDDEIEKLAVMEHDRWMRERIESGWTSGEKDVARKKTPYLVPFAELPADIAEYDRIFVREIPALLASVGMQVVRAPRGLPR